MKKLIHRMGALALAATLVFSLSVPASAFVLNQKSKSTAIGTIKGTVSVTDNANNHNCVSFLAETSVDSKYTMAQVVTKISCCNNDTGASLEFQPSNNYPSSTSKNRNENRCGHTHNDGQPIAVFTTHEATYNSSYALYMTSVYTPPSSYEN